MFVDSEDIASFGGVDFRCQLNEKQSVEDASGFPDVVTTKRSVFCPLKFVKELKQNDLIRINKTDYYVNYKLKTLKYFATISIRINKNGGSKPDQRHRFQSFEKTPGQRDKNI
jgi:hypothetical protein